MIVNNTKNKQIIIGLELTWNNISKKFDFSISVQFLTLTNLVLSALNQFYGGKKWLVIQNQASCQKVKFNLRTEPRTR